MIPDDPEGLSTRQGRLLLQMLELVPRQGPLEFMPPQLALCLFTGVLLNVPHMINAGGLKAPASQYTAPVATTIWRIFGLA